MVRGGLTKAEIAVVAVILVTAVALMIPFLLRQRVAARSVTCQDRLQRLAKAVERYDDQEKKLPGYANTIGSERITGWATLLLPHLSTAHPQGNRHLLEAHAAIVDQTQGPERLPELLCPAKRHHDRPSPLSFVANCGMPDADEDQTLPPDWPANGLFFDHAVDVLRKAETSLKWIAEHDGTTVTLLFAENVDARSWHLPGEEETGFVWAANMKEGVPSPLPTVWPLNQQRGEGDGTIKYARPSSLHGPGANVSMASGETRFLHENIDYLVFQRLMTADGDQVKAPGGEELLPPPWRHGEAADQ